MATQRIHDGISQMVRARCRSVVLRILGGGILALSLSLQGVSGLGMIPASLPKVIETNHGQFPGEFDFGFRGDDYSALFNSQTIALISRTTAPREVRLQLSASALKPTRTSTQNLTGKAHYLLGAGNDWKIDVPLVQSVRYSEIYTGIDLLFRVTENLLEYDLIVSPGSDPSQFKLTVEGADDYSIDSQGRLVLQKDGERFLQHRPRVFQKTASGNVEISCEYVIEGQMVALQFGSFDPSRELLVDPVLDYLAVVPGSSSEAFPYVAPGPDGRIYVAGNTKSVDFPAQNGFQNSFQGGTFGDGFVLCLSPDGSEVVFVTYLGGTEADYIRGLAVDATGIYVTGDTSSSNFPIKNAYQGDAGTADVFLTKLTLNGNALHFSTYLGGTSSEYAGGLALGSGGVFVGGSTGSADFPMKDAFQSQLVPTTDYSGSDYFLTRFSSTGQLLFSTYLGGSEYELGRVKVAASSDRVYLAGVTRSTDFPLKNPLRAAPVDQDIILSAFDASSGQLLFSTFWGGDSGDDLGDLSISADGTVYLAGNTASTDFPVVNPLPGQREDPVGAFITKFNSSHAVLYSHLFQKVGFHEGAIAAVPGGGLLLGYAASKWAFEWVDPLPLDLGHGPYVALLDPDGKVTFSSYVAEYGTVEDVALNPEGAALFVGTSSQSEKITVVNSPFQRLEGSGFDIFVGKITLDDNRLEITPVSGTPQSAKVGRPFAVPLRVKVSDSEGAGVPEISVTFAAPVSSASAVFAGGVSTASVTTNASGIATSPQLTANQTAGSYLITATAEGVEGEAQFSLTNLARSAAAIEAVSGSGQTAAVGTPLTSPFQVRVRDQDGETFAGVEVIFNVPVTGASGVFPSESTSASVQTNSSGLATSPILTANLQLGVYEVVAAIAGLEQRARFTVTNTIGPASLVKVHAGGGQIASVEERFLQPFRAIVSDLGGNPKSGITVIFSAPATGPSGTFANSSRQMTAVTGTDGLATASAFTANALEGTYSVTASVSGVESRASFVVKNSGGAILTVGSSSVVKGGSVEVPVTIFRGTDIAALQLDLGFDPGVLTLQGVDAGTLLQNHQLAMNTSTAGFIRAATASRALSGFATGPATFLVARFKVSDEAQIKSPSIRASSVTAFSRTGERVALDIRQGTLKIQENVCQGDLNADSMRDVSDLVMVVSHILGRERLTGAALAAADLNADGDVTVRDLVGLLSGITGAVELAPCAP